MSKKISFDGWIFDTISGELHKGKTKLRLREQALRFLAALLETPGELVNRYSLYEKIWPNASCLVDADIGLNKIVTQVRKALGDAARAPRYIQTIPCKGYRFIADLHPLPWYRPRPRPPKQPKTANEDLAVFLGEERLYQQLGSEEPVYRWPSGRYVRRALYPLPFRMLNTGSASIGPFTNIQLYVECGCPLVPSELDPNLVDKSSRTATFVPYSQPGDASKDDEYLEYYRTLPLRPTLLPYAACEDGLNEVFKISRIVPALSPQGWESLELILVLRYEHWQRFEEGEQGICMRLRLHTETSHWDYPFVVGMVPEIDWQVSHCMSPAPYSSPDPGVVECSLIGDDLIEDESGGTK